MTAFDKAWIVLKQTTQPTNGTQMNPLQQDDLHEKMKDAVKQVRDHHNSRAKQSKAKHEEEQNHHVGQIYDWYAHNHGDWFDQHFRGGKNEG